MRLFIALNFDEMVKDYLMDCENELKRICNSGNFTRRENFHITLNFIGETDRKNDIESVIKKVVRTLKPKGFPLTIGGLGKFNRRDGDLYWVGVKKNKTLYQINKSLSIELQAAGFTLDDKEFKPHLTLGRKIILQENYRKDSLDIEQKIFKNKREIEQFVKRISLMKSENMKGILTYTEVFRLDFE